MESLSLEEAQQQLPQLVAAALDGEEVLITLPNKPKIRLTPLPPSIKTQGYGDLALSPEALDAAFSDAVEAEVATLFQSNLETP